MTKGKYEEMVCGCRAGKRGAQAAFYDCFVQRLYVTACRLLNQSEEAEEVAHEVLLHVLTDTALLLDGCDDMARRLSRMAVNRSIDRLRQRKVTWGEWDESVEMEEDDGMEEVLLLEERSGLLRQAVEMLPEQCRTVLQLAVLEEMSTEDIAELLRIKPSGVRAHLSRAKQKLINLMKR